MHCQADRLKQAAKAAASQEAADQMEINKCLHPIEHHNHMMRRW